MNALTYCVEDPAVTTVHIVNGTRGVAKPICGPWWEGRTAFRRVAADRPTCRICLRILGERVDKDSPRIRLSTPLGNSIKPSVHLVRYNADWSPVPRCGGAGVTTKRYDVTTDVVTCKVCLGFTRGPGVRA